MSKAAQRIEAIARKLGLAIKSTFIPFSVSHNRNKESPSRGRGLLRLNWRITLTHNGRDIIEADYSAGCGHAPSYSQDRTKRIAEQRDLAVKLECESGFAYSVNKRRAPVKTSRAIMPEFADVIHSLVLDSDVLDYAGFEQWARELGYDEDSRKAEAIFRACVDIALKLRAAIGEAGLSELREACADY